MLLGVRKRAVRGDRLAVSHPYRRRGGGRVERLAGEHLAGLLELDGVRHVLVVDAPLFLLGHCGEALLGGVDQQCVFHWLGLLSRDPTIDHPPTMTPPQEIGGASSRPVVSPWESLRRGN